MFLDKFKLLRDNVYNFSDKKIKENMYEKILKKFKIKYNNITDNIFENINILKLQKKIKGYNYNSNKNFENMCIQNLKKKNIDILDISNKIKLLRKNFIKTYKKLIYLDKYLENLCIEYDKNYKMVENMNKIIGNKNIHLKKNLKNYLDKFFEENNIIKYIKKYKYLIFKCDYIKTCLIQFDNIQQINKGNKPICKICYNDISDNVCIPCGHLFCKKCLHFNNIYRGAINNDINQENINSDEIQNTNELDNSNENVNENLENSENSGNNVNSGNSNLFRNILSIFDIPTSIININNRNQNNNENRRNINIFSNYSSGSSFNNLFQNIFNDNINIRRMNNNNNQINQENKCPICRQNINKIIKIYF